MAAAYAAAMQAFAKQRERIAKKSKAVAEKLILLQSGFTNQPLAADLPQLGSLPPHLQYSSISSREGFHNASLPTSWSAGPE